MLSEEMALPSDVEGGMATYRTSLCLSLFYKFYVYVKSKISVDISDDDSSAISVSSYNTVCICMFVYLMFHIASTLWTQ